MKRVSNIHARPFIARREEFKGSNFYGENHTPGQYASRGRMPACGMKTLDTIEEADFIVYSYWTPIAWHIPGEGWIIPPVSYSSSTGRHMSYVRQAVWDEMSPRQLRDPWSLGCSGKAADILSAIRYGHSYTRQKGERMAPLVAVVATGEAEWVSPLIQPDTIRPVKGD